MNAKAELFAGLPKLTFGAPDCDCGVYHLCYNCGHSMMQTISCSDNDSVSPLTKVPQHGLQHVMILCGERCYGKECAYDSTVGVPEVFFDISRNVAATCNTPHPSKAGGLPWSRAECMSPDRYFFFDDSTQDISPHAEHEANAPLLPALKYDKCAEGCALKDDFDSHLQITDRTYLRDQGKRTELYILRSDVDIDDFQQLVEVKLRKGLMETARADSAQSEDKLQAEEAASERSPEQACSTVNDDSRLLNRSTVHDLISLLEEDTDSQSSLVAKRPAPCQPFRKTTDLPPNIRIKLDFSEFADRIRAQEIDLHQFGTVLENLSPRTWINPWTLSVTRMPRRPSLSTKQTHHRSSRSPSIDCSLRRQLSLRNAYCESRSSSCLSRNARACRSARVLPQVPRSKLQVWLSVRKLKAWLSPRHKIDMVYSPQLVENDKGQAYDRRYSLDQGWICKDSVSLFGRSKRNGAYWDLERQQFINDFTIHSAR